MIKSLFSDKKNIAIIVLSFLIVSLFVYIVASPSSYKKANKVLEQQYKALDASRKKTESELSLWKSKYKVLDKQDADMKKKIRETDSLLLIKEYQVYDLSRKVTLYKGRYDALNTEYWSKKNLIPTKTGDTLINSLKKRFK
jgi:peptidoglycan hydrolase CwlO-like protein